MARKKPEDGVHEEPVSEPAPEAETQEDRPNAPVHTVRFGLVKASVWRNESEKGTHYNVTVARLYKGTDDLWYTSQGFGFRDLLALAKALDWAHSYIAARYAQEDVPF